jgi:predicted enzyme related to lactoylglutathione lyase
MANRPIHFEIQADDAERAKKFYESALGWKIDKSTMPGVGMEYWMVVTGPDGTPGLNGGLYKRADNPTRKITTFDCTVQVDDIDKVIEAIKANGGKIEPYDGKEKWEMKGLGWFSRAVDPEGNIFGLLQATDWQAK